MKTIITLLFGLLLTSASFAQTTPGQPSDVVLSSANQRLHLYVAPQTTRATIKLHDYQGHLSYNHTANVANGFRQTFDLTNLQAGSYRLSVAKDGQTVNKTVVIESVPAQKQIVLESWSGYYAGLLTQPACPAG